MNRIKRIRMLKHMIYALLLLLLYLLQTVPGLFVVFGARPMFLVPAAIAIAMMEGEFLGGVYGAAAGLLCDISSSSLFGFNGFFLCLCCIGAGLLIIHLMHCNVWGCLLFSTITMLLCRSIEYFFAIGMWHYDNAWKVYTYDMLPTIAYTVLTAPLCYLVVRTVYLKIKSSLQD